MNRHPLRLARSAGLIRRHDLDGDESAAPCTRSLALFELHTHPEDASTLSNRNLAVETASLCSEPKGWPIGLSGERSVIAEYRRAGVAELGRLSGRHSPSNQSSANDIRL
jgi:hypothetical protein